MNLLRKFSHKYFEDPYFYFKVILRQLKFFTEYPIYILRESLNITKSIVSSFLSNSYKTNVFNRKLNGIKFIFDFNYSQKFRNRTMFFGLVQTEVVKVLLKYIKEGTVFIDVGASIGYMSAIGAGLVGKKGQVHSFEPTPWIFKKLKQMVELNKDYQIHINKCAIGETNSIGILDVTEIYGFGGNSLVPNLITPNNIQKKIEVFIRRLDDYLIENKIRNISLIKIDVEGFEFPVLKSLTNFFEKAKKKEFPPIIVEVTPHAYPLLGYNLNDLHNFMKKYAYSAFSLDERKQIDILKIKKNTDILFKQVD